MINLSYTQLRCHDYDLTFGALCRCVRFGQCMLVRIWLAGHFWASRKLSIWLLLLALLLPPASTSQPTQYRYVTACPPDLIAGVRIDIFVLLSRSDSFGSSGSGEHTSYGQMHARSFERRFSLTDVGVWRPTKHSCNRNRNRRTSSETNNKPGRRLPCRKLFVVKPTACNSHNNDNIVVVVCWRADCPNGRGSDCDCATVCLFRRWRRLSKPT